MIKVCVIGASGMLGHKLCQVLAEDPLFEVHAFVRDGAVLPPGRVVVRSGLDLLADYAAVERTIQQVRPRYVINAAGIIKQMGQQVSSFDMFQMNGMLPHLLSFTASTCGARVVHFSTDCVFDGKVGSYTEADPPNAADAYGRSKACGELHNERDLTIRTSIIGFELRGRVSLLSWILSQSPDIELKGFTRAIFSGLPTLTLSRTVRDLLRRDLPLAGLYHVASQPIDKYTLLTRFCGTMGIERRIRPDAEFSCDRSLTDGHFRTLVGTSTPDWDSLLEDLRQDYFSGLYGTVETQQTRA